VTLIDVPIATGENRARIDAALAGLGAGARLAAVVLTHIHPDHMGGAGELARAAGDMAALHVVHPPLP
jgi:glyoxylase-like metal-dependent hydrolase (beta-lactamase superfamily II)